MEQAPDTNLGTYRDGLREMSLTIQITLIGLRAACEGRPQGLGASDLKAKPSDKRFFPNGKPPSRGEWVYFAMEYRGSGRIKIGYTNDVPGRLKGLNVGNSSDIVLAGWCGGGRAVEGEIHRALEKYRLRGEWHKTGRKVRALLAALHARRDITPQTVRDAAIEVSLTR